MEISSILIGLVIFAGSLVFVGLPFQRKHRKGDKTVKAQVQTAEQRETALYALRELDFDFKTGKVSEEDYNSLRAKLLAQAAQFIEREKGEDDRLEALIRSRRAAQQHGTKCDHCGAALEEGQSFCAKCGTAVNKALCPQCGRKIHAGDMFCSACGTRLEVQVEAVAQS